MEVACPRCQVCNFRWDCYKEVDSRFIAWSLLCQAPQEPCYISDSQSAHIQIFWRYKTSNHAARVARSKFSDDKALTHCQ
eukprot:2872295-Amphidinium_carterae.1